MIAKTHAALSPMKLQHKIIKIDPVFVDSLIKDLLLWGNVKVTHLGVFKLKKTTQQTRYIPATGKLGIVKGRVRITFKPALAVKTKLQKYHGK